jgi:hypothetical protein
MNKMESTGDLEVLNFFSDAIKALKEERNLYKETIHEMCV